MATQSQPSRSPNPSHRRLQLDIDDEQIEKIDLMRGRRADRKARSIERNVWLETLAPDKTETPEFWEKVVCSEAMIHFAPMLASAGTATAADMDDGTDWGDNNPIVDFPLCLDQDSDGHGDSDNLVFWGHGVQDSGDGFFARYISQG